MIRTTPMGTSQWGWWYLHDGCKTIAWQQDMLLVRAARWQFEILVPFTRKLRA